MSRPFFSVVVPCYNSRHTIGKLLSSIVDQQMEYDEIEVILSDDHSTESYEDIVEEYKKVLNIIQVQTDYNYCPGNTRQRGVDAATGKWIVFADHDDEFYPDVFKQVKKDILDSGVNTMYISQFVKISIDGRTIPMNSHGGWTHGKFFNNDNFWKKYNLYYIKDLKSHEDISISSRVNYIRQSNPELLFCESKLTTYKWNENPNSLSNRQYETADGYSRNFIDVYFLDYLKSTIGVFWEEYLRNNKKQTDKNFMATTFANIMLYGYFYLQFALHIAPKFLKENYQACTKWLHILNDQFGWTIEKIYHYFKYENQQDYQLVYTSAINLTTIMLCEHSFKQWLDIMYNERYKEV